MNLWYRYIIKAGTAEGGAGAEASQSLTEKISAMLRGRKLSAEPIAVRGIDEAKIQAAAKATAGFSGGSGT